MMSREGCRGLSGLRLVNRREGDESGGDEVAKLARSSWKNLEEGGSSVSTSPISSFAANQTTC